MEQTETKNKLSDLLSTLSDDELIFIGSATSWFFIGTVEEYRRYEKAIDRKLMDYWKDKIKIEKDNIQKLCKSYYDSVEKELETRGNPETDGFNLTAWYRTYFKNIRFRNTFIPTADREVIDTYQRIEEGTAIVLEGSEVGEHYDWQEWVEFGGEEKLKKYMEEIKNDADT